MGLLTWLGSPGGQVQHKPLEELGKHQANDIWALGWEVHTYVQTIPYPALPCRTVPHHTIPCHTQTRPDQTIHIHMCAHMLARFVISFLFMCACMHPCTYACASQHFLFRIVSHRSTYNLPKHPRNSNPHP